MAAKRWLVEETEGFDAGNGTRTRTFSVRDRLPGRYRDAGSVVAGVWLSAHDTPRCASCQGQLTAMRSDCEHASAVKRHLAKAATAPHPPEKDLVNPTPETIQHS